MPQAQAISSPYVDVIVIGGGPAGLALSHELCALGVEHVVLERGRIGERWRSERWDSLRLLTPNWLTRLPGLPYRGDDPDGFMRAGELLALLERYAGAFGAPVRGETAVTAVQPGARGYRVLTDGGELRARAVVIATGDAGKPFVPELAARLSPALVQLTASQYKRPGDLPPGGVLVVGASASGAQLADELQRSGRQVTLAAGRHLRIPRSYRGRDVFCWLERMGALGQRAADVPDLEAARRVPSYQLIGRDGGPGVDLIALRERGVVLTGRLVELDGNRARFADDLAASAAHADEKMAHLLDRIDAFATASDLDGEVEPPVRPVRVVVGRTPARLNLEHAGIRSVLWATGYTRSYPWLRVPGALDRRGQLVHDGGVLKPPGLYAMGLRFMRRRSSSFLCGVGSDAAELAAHIRARLDRPSEHAA